MDQFCLVFATTAETCTLKLMHDTTMQNLNTYLTPIKVLLTNAVFISREKKHIKWRTKPVRYLTGMLVGWVSMDQNFTAKGFTEMTDTMSQNNELREALQALHDDVAEYQRINHLGGYDNHNMKRARAALAAQPITTESKP